MGEFNVLIHRVPAHLFGITLLLNIEKKFSCISVVCPTSHGWDCMFQLLYTQQVLPLVQFCTTPDSTSTYQAFL